MSTFYPPHVKIINEVFSASAEQIAEAERVVELYQAAVERGEPAVLADEGEVLLIHDYEKASRAAGSRQEVAQWDRSSSSRSSLTSRASPP